MTEAELVERCLRNDKHAQHVLYDRYVNQMARLCLRYIKDREATKDVLADGFIKVFDRIKRFSYQGNGSLEAWLRKVFVNECLMTLRRRKSIFLRIETDFEMISADTPVYDHLAAEELLAAIIALPDGFRTIFNLYCIEGFSHLEIAEKLNISESTSRSQLAHARKALKHSIEKTNNDGK